MWSPQPRKEPTFAVGQRIQGYLDDEWQPGRVTFVHRDGSYGVKFDDGCEMDDMSELELRPMEDEVLIAAAAERDRLWKLHSKLRLAANHGHLSDAKALLEVEGIDVNNKDGAGWSALTWACKMGRLEMARHLLSVEADIDTVDNNADTSLIWAVRKNQVEVVQLLTEAGAALDCVNQDGWTALMEASYRGYNEVLSLLLHSKAKISIINNEGKTAMDLAKTPVTRGLIQAADGEYY